MASDPSGLRITFGGLATGLDSNALVDALLEVERIPLRRLEGRKDDLEQQRSRFRELNSLLANLRDAARAVDNLTDGLSGPSLDEELLAFTASSSDENVLTAEADSNAIPGSYDVRVDSLASVGRRVSIGFASADDEVTNKNRNFTIDYGGSAAIDISVAKGTTLQQLRDLINSDPNNDGSVQADILFDGSEHRLLISGTEVGAAHDVVVTTNINGFIDDALTQTAQDARLVVFGVPITRTSNDIDDVIPGVTLHLEGTHDPANPNERADLSVTRDDAAIGDKLQALVDAYNAVRSFMQRESAVDPETERAGPLSGDPTLRAVDRTLQTALVRLVSFTDNPFSSLSDIGVRFDSDGKLTLERDVLNDALEQDARAVRQLLSGDGVTDGLAAGLARALEPILQTGDGTLALRDSSYEDRIRDLENSIERMERRVARREENLILKFTQLESLVASFQAQTLFLNGFGR